MQSMGTYVMLSRLSPKGGENAQAQPRAYSDGEQGGRGARSKGVQYAILGTYDFMTVLEAPNIETVARISVELGARESGHYETFVAIPVDTFVPVDKSSISRYHVFKQSVEKGNVI